MAASGPLKERIQLLQAAKARAEATGKSLKPDVQRELDSYAEQGLLGGSRGGGGKPATREGEDKANAFLIRALGANKGYEATGVGARSLVGQAVADSAPNFLNTLPGFVGNSEERQVSDTTQDEFIAASLRQDSGAAIPEEEMERQRRIYFPMPGDGEKVIEAKRQARVRAIQGLVASAGRAVSPDLATKYPQFFEQSKGGDPASGASGATDGSGPGTPPDPLNPNGRWGAGPADDETGQMVNGFAASDQTVAREVQLSDEQKGAIAALAKTGGTTEQMLALLGSYGLQPRDATQVEATTKWLEAVKADPDKAFQVQVDNTVKPVDPALRGGNRSGSEQAAGAGLASNIPFSREIGAVVDTVAEGGTYEDNLNTRKGERLFMEENNPFAYASGAVVGALPTGNIGMGSAKAAASLAGREALRAGATIVEARAAANRVFAARSAAAAAAQSGLYSFGNANGDFGDRLGAAVVGATVGGLSGGALTLGGGRVANAMRARAGRLASEPPSEANQLVRLADEQGVTLMPQDVGGPGIGRLTQGMAQSVFGAGAVQRGGDKLYDSFSGRVAEVGGAADTVTDVGATLTARSAQAAGRNVQRADDTSAAVERAVGAPDDLTGAGQVVQRGVSRFMDDTAERANQLFARVPIPESAEASVASTRGVLRDLTAGMRSNPELGAMFDSPRLQGYLRALTPQTDEAGNAVPNTGALSWQDLQAFRTRVGDMLDDPRLSEKIAPRQLRALYGALTSDMEATARGQGETALRAWRRANSYYAARMKRVEETLAPLVGDRRDRTPNEVMSKLSGMLKAGSTDNAASFGRVLRSLPTDDARIVRATIVNDTRGGRQFDAGEFAKRWDGLSERGKSVLLPEPGLRSIMDDAADRAAASTKDPLAGMSGEKAYLALEAMANNRGNSAEFQRRMGSMSAEEANAVRSLFVHRMGLANAGAQDAEGGAFSIGKFLTRWNDMTPRAKLVLFGNAEMRADMDALAKIAEKVKASERMRGYSNTGGVNAANAIVGLGSFSLGGLGGVAVTALAQRGVAEMLTSRWLVRWLARAPKKPNIAAQRQHVARLSVVARSEPAIANEVLGLQQRLLARFETAPVRAAADERADRRAPVDRKQRQDQAYGQGAQP